MGLTEGLVSPLPGGLGAGLPLGLMLCLAGGLTVGLLAALRVGLLARLGGLRGELLSCTAGRGLRSLSRLMFGGSEGLHVRASPRGLSEGLSGVLG